MDSDLYRAHPDWAVQDSRKETNPQAETSLFWISQEKRYRII